MKLPYLGFFFFFVSYYFHVNIYVDKICLLVTPIHNGAQKTEMWERESKKKSQDVKV